MKTIQLLLTETIDNLGIVGEVVTVKPGYARNYLIPRSLATSPTPGSIKRLAERRAQVEQERRELHATQQTLIQQLESVELTLERSANNQGVLYGGISQHDIALALQDKGYHVEDRAVRIGEQIKRLDSYQIPIVLDDDLKAQIKLWVVSDKSTEADDTDAQPESADDTQAQQPQAVGED